MVRMGKQNWQLKDAVDFEWFLAEDSRDPDGARRNREIGRILEGGDGARLRGWLSERRLIAGQDAGRPLPGTVVEEFMRMLAPILLVAGCLVGISATFGMLAYDGVMPINIAHALGVLVLPQLLFFLFTLRVMLFRKFFPGRLPLFYRLLFSFLASLFRSMVRKLPREMQGRLSVLSANRKGWGRKWQAVLWRLLFSRMQFFAFGYAVGVAVGMVLKVSLSDLAFGWQTSLAVEAGRVTELVQMVGLPWKEIAPSAVPDLLMIEGSRLILKEGIHPLATENLMGWWRFLFAATLCYGVFPRLLLFVTGLVFERRIDFTPDARSGRIRKLLLEFRSGQGEDRVVDVRNGTGPDNAEFSRYRLVLHEEIPENGRSRVEAEVRRFMGEDPVSVHDFLPESHGERGDILVVALEVWQPPIRERLEGLKAQGRKTPDETIWIWPVGMTGKDGAGRPPKETELSVWERALASLPDPRPVLIRQSREAS